MALERFDDDVNARRSVQACETTVQETTVNNKENNRRCTNAQQLRRDPVLQQARQHSISVGMVCGWINRKLMPGLSDFLGSTEDVQGLSDAHPL